MFIMNRNKFLIILSLILIITSDLLIGCKKLVDVEAPSNAINGANVYSTDATAAGVITAFYANMSSGSTSLAFSTGASSISVLAGLSSDEFTLWNGSTNASYVAEYQNKLTELVNPPFWNNLYSFIYRINEAIEGISTSTGLTPSIKQQLLGESKFLRGLCFFYLVNMYGDVPLAITTDYTVNAAMKRTDKTVVWNQIIKDLQEAAESLSLNYLSANITTTTSERVRPTKAAANALLARAYLFQKDWVNAEARATTVLDNKELYDTVSLSSVFLKNTKEAIWQLQPVNTGWNTEDAKVFSLTSVPTGLASGKFLYLSASQYNSFETNDLRKVTWVGTFTNSGITYQFPNKYKAATSGAPVTEYLMVLRVAEQYLIRAEARAMQNKISEAKDDLNVIRTRAGLPGTTANDQLTLLSAILHERQTELFSEWGHRWFDLKRTGNINAVMTTAALNKGTNWDARWQLYPLPSWDRQKNPLLVQNDGY
jgi:hypothetical protein